MEKMHFSQISKEGKEMFPLLRKRTEVLVEVEMSKVCEQNDTLHSGHTLGIWK